MEKYWWRVVILGGLDAELYDIGLEFRSAWQPAIKNAKIASAKSWSTINRLSASKASRKPTAAAGQDSSTSYPVVQLRSIDNSQMTYLLVDPVRGWSNTTLARCPLEVYFWSSSGDRLYQRSSECGEISRRSRSVAAGG